MRLCLPVDASQGLESPVSAHFGLAPFYLMVDTQTRQHWPIGNHNPHYFGGDCQPMANWPDGNVDAVVTGGIGLRALARLETAGIPVFISESTSLAEAVTALMEGRLRRATAETACRSGAGAPLDPTGPCARPNCCLSC